MSEKKVAQVMREPGLVARRKRRFRAATDSQHHDPIAPNLLERGFSASAPNEAWVTDVTSLWTHAGWLVVAAILDLYCQRVVGWAASANNAPSPSTPSEPPSWSEGHHPDGSITKAAGAPTAAPTTAMPSSGPVRLRA